MVGALTYQMLCMGEKLLLAAIGLGLVVSTCCGHLQKRSVIVVHIYIRMFSDLSLSLFLCLTIVNEIREAVGRG